jgi:hypothetical protein
MATQFTWIHFEATFIELRTSISLSQASLQSKLLKRDLSFSLEWSTQPSSKHFINDFRVFVFHGDLSPRWTRCCPWVTKVVVNLKKLHCPLLRGDLIVENRTKSLWSFGEVLDWERSGSLWAPQRRRRLPLWLAKLWEQILCLLCFFVLIYSLFLLKFILA